MEHANKQSKEIFPLGMRGVIGRQIPVVELDSLCRHYAVIACAGCVRTWVLTRNRKGVGPWLFGKVDIELGLGFSSYGQVCTNGRR